ncbi:asparagine synthase-related protein [Alkalihalobacterium alkalinitrilicum]|uniref:asparagine synthase-related protein n=1 Tax=Alkalihalobacterium alkalinitrilicum TaxID=427920 RepID=UPI0009954425|nr:asparagine synthase-related protein [Alkalihalobacterium alkalinitrilicum]
MSAIAGIVHLNKEPIKIEQAKDLMNSYQQFPADDVQTWKKDHVFFGCYAQWITPESVGEQQPYYDYERQLVITSDAIIDNRDELFNKLHIELQERKTLPDSQLILLAYEKWGEDVPKHLIGDFAFMIWDEKRRKLFGARDFSGARTLYFYQNETRFAFSTTINPLFTFPYVEKTLNEEWLAEFLAIPIPNMVEAVDMVSTIYQSIHQIPPSHSITVVEERVKLTRYCTIDIKDKLKLKSSEEYKEAFHEVFNKAITARLRTHGEIGAQLSGGLDSGTVVSFAAKALKKENKMLHTYSYIPEDDFVDWTSNYYIPDERPFIKETVNYVGNISDQYLDFAGRNPLSEVDDFLNLMEMPYKFFENSFWLKGITEIAQKQGIKILLNGARGNHSISWGSWRLTTDYYAELLKKLKWIQLNKDLTDYTKHYQTGKSNILPIIAKKAFPIIDRFQNKEAQRVYQFPQIISSNLARKTKVFDKLQQYGLDLLGGAEIRNLNEFRKSYYKQLFPWNKSGVANTNLSLRYGVWDRDPTNDLRVIQFCLALPEEQYVKEGMERSFLRRATQNALPDKVRLNQKSRGIQGADVIHRMVPQWGTFIEALHQLCKDPVITEILNIQEVKRALSSIGNFPRPEDVYSNEFKVLTRSLIVYFFIKQCIRKGVKI